MGLILRGDPPRSIDLDGRTWGEPVDGVALSIREIKREDPAELPAVSAVMRNSGARTFPLVIPGWVHFYRMEIDAPMTAYGRALTRPGKQGERVEISLGPGDATETDLPLGTVYELRKGTAYRVAVSCEFPGGAVLRSNEVVIRL
jgi:hypothetical protein